MTIQRRLFVTIGLFLLSVLFDSPTLAFAIPSLSSRRRTKTTAATTTTAARKSNGNLPPFMSSSSNSNSEDGNADAMKLSISTTADGSAAAAAAAIGTEQVNGSTGFFIETTNTNNINNSNNKLFTKLRQVSNIASFLCVLDCTILPIITVALPLLGILNLGPSQMEFLHVLGHKLALYFVLPVGGLTGILNYMSHKKSWIASLSALGLVMVGLANSHMHHLPIFGHVEWLHLIQHGPWHRVVNIVGCSCLLGSNYLSQQQGCAFHDHDHDSCDSHNHSHSHDHDHSCHEDHSHD